MTKSKRKKSKCMNRSPCSCNYISPHLANVHCGRTVHPSTVMEPSLDGPVVRFTVEGKPELSVEDAVTVPLPLPLPLPELELSEPVMARLLIASGLLSMKAMVGPATMFPRNLSRALLFKG